MMRTVLLPSRWDTSCSRKHSDGADGSLLSVIVILPIQLASEFKGYGSNKNVSIVIAPPTPCGLVIYAAGSLQEQFLQELCGHENMTVQFYMYSNPKNCYLLKCRSSGLLKFPGNTHWQRQRLTLSKSFSKTKYCGKITFMY